MGAVPALFEPTEPAFGGCVSFTVVLGVDMFVLFEVELCVDVSVSFVEGDPELSAVNVVFCNVEFEETEAALLSAVFRRSTNKEKQMMYYYKEHIIRCQTPSKH